jgi:hypothetical protein
MIELTPVKRVDKNGVLTTKHVRADVQKKNPISVPAPAIGAPKVKYTPTANVSTVQKRWNVNKSQWGPSDDELNSLCTERFTYSQAYDCSEAEAYDVMSVVSPENTLPLLAVGIRSAANARQFLAETGMPHLQVDSSALTDQAIARGIPARLFIDFVGKHSNYTGRDTFFDAAECWSIPELRDTDYVRSKQSSPPLKPLCEMILDDEIAWSDIKKIGFRAVAQRSRGADRLVNHLIRLHNGSSGFKSASEIAEVIKVGSSSIDLDIADLYGIAGYRKMGQKEQRWTANNLRDAFRERQHSPEERFRIYEYVTKVGVNPDPKGMISLYEAGVSAEKAREGINNGLPANQIIGLNSGEVSPSISSGYL